MKRYEKKFVESSSTKIYFTDLAKILKGKIIFFKTGNNSIKISYECNYFIEKLGFNLTGLKIDLNWNRDGSSSKPVTNIEYELEDGQFSGHIEMGRFSIFLDDIGNLKNIEEYYLEDIITQIVNEVE